MTEFPEGAGNWMVGPFCRDYHSLAFGDLDINYTNEVSMILMDGRNLSHGQEDNVFAPDLDIDEATADRGSIVDEDTRMARLHSARIRIYHSVPQYDDAVVWRVPLDGSGFTEIGPYDEYLDDLIAPGEEPNAGRTNYWRELRHFVKCPVFWAFYRIPTSQLYEGISDMLTENAPGLTEQAAPLVYGPAGMVAALHGVSYSTDDNRDVRLWSNVGENIQLVERGMYDIDYTHNSVFEWGGCDPDEYHVASGPGIVGDDVTQPHFIRDRPAQRAMGRIHTQFIESTRDVRAREDEVYVFHLQTGPVRIGFEEGATGEHLILGGSDNPLTGPRFHVTYVEASARFSAR